ncbi:hypothetical protein PO124_30935 [Bacillus licheniformis]|nr:hypothetical protein [Bacillus licheniformis]
MGDGSSRYIPVPAVILESGLKGIAYNPDGSILYAGLTMTETNKADCTSFL